MLLMKIIISVLSQCVLFDNSVTAAISTNQHIKIDSVNPMLNEEEKKTTHDNSFKPDIISDKKRMLCHQSHCQFITNFSIIDNFRVNSSEQYLPINFLGHRNITVTAFLDAGSNEMHSNN
jgi:hypothetical protein